MKLLTEKAFCICHSFVSSAMHLKYSHHLNGQQKWIKESKFYKIIPCHQHITTVINTGQNDLAIIRAIFLVNIYTCSSLKSATAALTHGCYYFFPFLLYVRQTQQKFCCSMPYFKLQSKVFLY